MTAPTITTAEEVYAFIAELKTACQERGETDLASDLNDAMCLGSSGLEIFGAIRNTLIENRAKVELLLGSDGLPKANQVVDLVHGSFTG